MKRSTISVLLSALVFPGAGHLFLKKYLRGAALLILALTGIIAIMVTSVQRAIAIVEKIQNGDVPLEMQALSELVSKSSSRPEGLLVNIASLVVLLCWIIGIVDSYRIGQKQKQMIAENDS
jgi:hypothetical protein